MKTITPDALAEHLNIGHLPLHEQHHIIGEAGQFIMTEVILATLALLPAHAQEELKQLMEEGRGDAAEEYAGAYIPNFSTFVAEHTAQALEKVRSAIHTT